MDFSYTSNDIKLDLYSGAIYTVRWNEDGTYIAAGGVDRTIKLLNMENLDTEIEQDNDAAIEEIESDVFEEQIANSAVTSLEWSTLEDSQLIASSADHTAIIYDLNKSAKIKTFRHPGTVNQLSISKKDLIVTACDDGMVRTWDKRSKFAVNTIKSNHLFPILTCCIDRDENRVYYSGIDPTISCYDIRKLDLAWSESHVHLNNVTSLSLSPDESYLLSKSIDNTVKYCDSRLIEMKNHSKPYIFDGTTATDEDWLIRAKFIPDPEDETGELLNVVSGSNDGYTYVWEFSSRKIINRLDGHKAAVLDMDYSEINDQLVTSSMDGSLIIRKL